MKHGQWYDDVCKTHWVERHGCMDSDLRLPLGPRGGSHPSRFRSDIRWGADRIRGSWLDYLPQRQLTCGATSQLGGPPTASLWRLPGFVFGSAKSAQGGDGRRSSPSNAQFIGNKRFGTILYCQESPYESKARARHFNIQLDSGDGLRGERRMAEIRLPSTGASVDIPVNIFPDDGGAPEGGIGKRFFTSDRRANLTVSPSRIPRTSLQLNF